MRLIKGTNDDTEFVFDFDKIITACFVKHSDGNTGIKIRFQGRDIACEITCSAKDSHEFLAWCDENEIYNDHNQKPEL